MPSDWSFVVNDVAPASTSAKALVVITASSNCDVIPRRVEVTHAAAETIQCRSEMYRCTSVSGGTSVTATNLDSGSSETQRFTVVKNPTSLTLGALIDADIIQSNYGTAVLSLDAGLSVAGAKLRSGESIAIVFTQNAAQTVSPNYITPNVAVSISQ